MENYRKIKATEVRVGDILVGNCPNANKNIWDGDEWRVTKILGDKRVDLVAVVMGDGCIEVIVGMKCNSYDLTDSVFIKYRRVKNTGLARKLYPNCKEKEGFLYV